MRFFNEDVHKAWLRWTKAVTESIRDSIPIITDFLPVEHVPENQGDIPRSERLSTDHGIAKIAVDYAQEKDYVKKAKEIVGFEREGACSVCENELEHDAGIYTICPNPGCEAVTHMTCLSKHFLKDDSESLIPIDGCCPSCKTELRWVDVMKELSLRMRGQKEVEKLLKAKRVRKRKATASQTIIDSDIEDEDEDDDLEGDIKEELKRLKEFNPTGARMDTGDRWHAFATDSDNTDASSMVSTTSQSKAKSRSKASVKKAMSSSSKDGLLKTVIEDSDWDDALTLD